MERIELGCLFCSKYSLVTPVHGYGDAPYYKCSDDRNPEECEVCKHNINKSCAKGDVRECNIWAGSSDRVKQ